MLSDAAIYELLMSNEIEKIDEDIALVCHMRYCPYKLTIKPNELFDMFGIWSGRHWEVVHFGQEQRQLWHILFGKVFKIE